MLPAAFWAGVALAVVDVPSTPAPTLFAADTRLAFDPPASPGEDARYASRRRVPGPESDPGRPPEYVVVLAPPWNATDREARYTCAPVHEARPFRDVLTSWNVDCPPQTGFCVELRVAAEKQEWSPWLYIGDWGELPSQTKTLSCDGGKVDTDFFRGERAFASWQVRVRAFAQADAQKRDVVLQRLNVCVAGPAPSVSRPTSESSPAIPAAPKPGFVGRLDVPFRSQRSEDRKIEGRICSPTALSMVLAYRGVDRPTGEVADRAYDAEHDIYGNWPRNIQAAFSFGVPGYLTRFTHWGPVESLIQTGQPLIVSIGVKDGALHGAPYTSTTGHLIVITGFEENGDVCVNDPAATDASKGQLVYTRADLQKAWIDRGGTAYVLLPKP